MNEPEWLTRARAEGRILQEVTAKPTTPTDASNEADFQSAVLMLARACGWLCYHTYDSRRSQAGFPDLVMVRDRVVYAELKSTNGKATTAQKEWLASLRAVGQEVYEWRPKDWAEIVEVLK